MYALHTHALHMNTYGYVYMHAHAHTRAHKILTTDACVHICVSMSMRHVCTEVFTDAHVQTYSARVPALMPVRAYTHIHKGGGKQVGFL